MLNKKTYLIFLLLVLLAITNSFWFAVKGGSSEGSKNRDTVRVIQRVVIPPDTIFQQAKAIIYYKRDTIYIDNIKISESDSSAFSENQLRNGGADTTKFISPAFLAVDTLRSDKVDVFSEYHFPEMLFKTRVELKLDTIFVEIPVECPEVNELTFFEEIWLDYGLPVFGGVFIYAILAS